LGYKVNEPKVAIVVCTYSQDQLLRECLKSLEKIKYKNYGVYFVDDTGRGLGKEIKKEFKVTLITTKGCSGQSKVWNAGIKRALEDGFDYVLLIDDDMDFPDKKFLNKVVNVGESKKEIGMVGCGLKYPNGKPQHFGGYIKSWRITKELKERKEAFEVDHIMGCFMLIKKQVIDEIGLVDEVFNPYLLEETDYCLRVKRGGFKIFSASYVKVLHKQHGTISSIPHFKKRFVRFKNDIIFSRRHFNLKNRLFRLWIYLPLVAIFRKKTDEDELNFKNFRLRKEFLVNLIILIYSFLYIKTKRMK
jgi:GT2 family glycosyltransferase